MTTENDIKKVKNKNIIKILCFLFGIVIISAILSIPYKREDGLNVYDSLSVSVKSADIKAEPDNSLQILFFGDSECYASFSPDILKSNYGFTSYNCGTAAQKICDTYAILHENLKTQSPKIVILETNLLYRGLKESGGTPDPVMDILTDNIPLFAYHSDWKHIARKALPQSREIKRRKNRGFVVRKGVIPYKDGNYMKETSSASAIDKDIISYVEKINNLCIEHNTILLLVSTPAPKNWNYKKHNGVINLSDSYDIDYLDLNLEEDLKINWKKDTKDGGDHLNLSGAKKVTKYIGKYLKEEYNLISQ